MTTPKGMLYTLDGHTPVESRDVMAWAAWFADNDRHVGLDKIGSRTVSTIFMAVNYNWWPDGVPILFETMVFADSGEIETTQRYATWEAAAAGHADVVALLKEQEPTP